LVLDASAALGIAMNRAGANPGRIALPEAGEVLAPDLFVAEVTNAVWKYQEFSSLALTDAESILEAALGLVDTFISSGELYRAARALSRATHRSVYDMFYLALARREGAPFLTLDKTLRREASRQGLDTL
jgi:predicted nucleic acid-binding protein